MLGQIKEWQKYKQNNKKATFPSADGEDTVPLVDHKQK